MPLDIQKTIEKIRADYTSDNTADKINVLAMGDFGTGKSTLASTLPKPILVHSFDPGGMRSSMIRPLIESGDILVERFEDEDAKKPTQFARYEKRMDELFAGGFFQSGAIKSYVIDSLTSLADCTMNFIAGKAGRAGQVAQLQDYQIQQMLIQQLVKKCCGFPVHFMLTGHIKSDKDEITGRIITSLLVSGKMDVKIPLLFDEVYVTVVTADSKGPTYTVLTGNEGFYRARTRIGAGKFELREKPNLTELFKKGGITA